MRISRKLNRPVYDYSKDEGLERSYVRQPSLVDSFYISENTCPETGETTYQISHPLYMLFNQERLDRLGSEAVNQWLKSLESSGSSQLDVLRRKVSDDDLLAMVKSRHIQHPCELERYITQLNDRMDFCNAEIGRMQAEQRAEQERLDAERLAQTSASSINSQTSPS